MKRPLILQYRCRRSKQLDYGLICRRWNCYLKEREGCALYSLWPTKQKSNLWLYFASFNYPQSFHVWNVKILQGGPKNGTIVLYALSSSNINRFSKFFHCQNQEKIVNKTITKDPTTPQVCRYTTLWNVRLLTATIIENKTTSVTTHFKKVTTGNNVFIVPVIVSKVAQLSHQQFSHQMFNVSTLLLEDALKPATPLTNGAINETHRAVIFAIAGLSC